MTKSELDYAIRRAHNLFDKWNDVTGFVEPCTGYYDEIQGIIEDAVHCGAQAALKIKEPLESEKYDQDEAFELLDKLDLDGPKAIPVGKPK